MQVPQKPDAWDPFFRNSFAPPFPLFHHSPVAHFIHSSVVFSGWGFRYCFSFHLLFRCLPGKGAGKEKPPGSVIPFFISLPLISFRFWFCENHHIRRSFEKNLGCIHILLSFAFFSLILLIYLILLLIPVLSSSSLIHSRSRSFAIPCLLPRFIWYISRTDSISRLDCSPQTLQTCLPRMLR